MKIIKNKSTIISVICILGIIILFLISKYNSFNQDNIEYTTTVNQITESILGDKFNDLKQNQINVYKSQIEKIQNRVKQPENNLKCNFILGYINILEKDNKQAISNLNKSIKLFDKENDVAIKARIYYDLSRVYIYQNEYNKSKQIFNKLKKITMEQNRKDLFIKYSISRATDLNCNLKWKNDAVKLEEDALKIAQDINYSDIEDVYFQLGVSYWYTGKVVQSITMKLRALDIAMEKKMDEKICYIETDIAIDYFYAQEYQEAKKYLCNQLKCNLSNKYKDTEIKTYALLNLTEVYTKMGYMKSAEKSFNELNNMIKNNKNGYKKEDTITAMYVNKAIYEIEEEQALKAIKYLDIAKSRFEKRSDFSFYDTDIKIIETYGDAYYKMGEYQKALKYHLNAKEMSKGKDILYKDITYNQKIAKDYKALGNLEECLNYIDKNDQLREKINKSKNDEYVRYLSGKFETEKKEEEISKLKESKNIMYFIFAILIIIIIVVIIFVSIILEKNKEIIRLNELFKNRSITDGLTEVQNRRALDTYLSQNWATYKKIHMPITFIMVDVDYFKNYNDNYGHPEGDKALQTIAKIIKTSCRNVDFVSRYGGEEFMVIMLDTYQNEAIKLVERIQNNLYDANIKHEYSSVSDRVTLSIGITTAYEKTEKSYKYYIKRVDEALYLSKKNGRNMYTYLE